MNWNIREWTKRYIPSEIIASILAVGSATIVHKMTGNSILSALAGTWGENLGYYGTIIFRDLKEHKKKNTGFTFKSILKILRNLIIEFGPAEMLDSFLIRPFMMYIFPKLVNNFMLGILLGKISADIIFYIPTIISYELKKKHLKK